MLTHHDAVHGYSLLRTQLNMGYFNDIFNESVKFGVDIEGHRMEDAVFSETIC